MNDTVPVPCMLMLPVEETKACHVRVTVDSVCVEEMTEALSAGDWLLWWS